MLLGTTPTTTLSQVLFMIFSPVGFNAILESYGLRAPLLPWFLGAQGRGGYVREDRTGAGNNMTFAPGRSEGCSERFQLPLKIANGFPAGLRREFKIIVFLEIENPQVELCRRLRESLMIDHAVGAIHDPSI